MVFGSDGHIDAAGGMVWRDGSASCIGRGSADVSGPWHRYRRPVCWGVGMVAATTERWAATPLPGTDVSDIEAAGVTDDRRLTEWCGSVWADGGRVVHDPDVISVRLAGTAGDLPAPASTTWRRVLSLRPGRPDTFSDGVWRHVLAHDDVEAVGR